MAFDPNKMVRVFDTFRDALPERVRTYPDICEFIWEAMVAVSFVHSKEVLHCAARMISEDIEKNGMALVDKGLADLVVDKDGYIGFKKKEPPA